MQTQYRPEIDGLRTIAVISVLIYHAQFMVGGYALLPGGYLGVDVFFVISGYLITLILLKEMRANTFTFRNFYERRARRILPVLFVVMLVSSWLAWSVMVPKALMEYAGSQLSSLFFGSNFWFFLEDSYIAEASELKPLLHTWSLSLEEQFYVFFPILLLLVITWKKWTNQQLLLLLAVFFVLSVSFAQYASTRYVDMNFYLPASRSWELLCGAMIATLEYDGKRPKPNAAYPSFVPAIGLLMIVVPMFLYHDDWTHPSILTLAPVLGTGLLIWFTPKQSASYKLLASRSFVSIGLISYSLYLWHFPALAFARITKVEALTTFEKIACLLISALLATIGYFILERPARNRKLVSSKVFFSILTAVITILIGFSVMVLWSNGASHRLGSVQSIFEGARNDDSYLFQHGKRCDLKPVSAEKSCFFRSAGNNPDDRTIINIGDSHADVLSNQLLELSKQNNWHYQNLTLSGCPYVEGAFRFKTGVAKNRCDARQMSNFKKILENTPPSIIVYSARFPGYISGRPFDNLEGGKESQASNRKLRVDPEGDYPSHSLEQLIHLTIDNMITAGHTVVLIYPIPEVGWDVPKIVKKALDKVPSSPISLKRTTFENMEISTRYDVYNERSRETIKILDKIKSSPALIRIKPDKIFCSSETGRCYTHNKSKLYYYDNNHLSQIGAKMLVKQIEKALNTLNIH